ncbi:hypothetical protein CBLAS_0418 [Campylobacter blaseri]|uniref:Uncharacterized protein n=1 Tax=Campylobacter blaseri TaxID=2042961 RepID=A0A2P8R0M3_9BACT|nr:hypothetical protein [Campylobacter blaseri]PSM52042.1 hypothetical protein CQ405_05645 [Campylobacter blaseri]PSM53827.1 hypothetical protein CRN67_05645 [Campylobacter blaseri]QKF85621.1 hypothetical protein CBLAS_0418 [Campylobacter blaseri]
MQIIGHKLIEFTKFNSILNIRYVSQFDNLIFDFDENFVEEAKKHKKEFSIIIGDETQAVLSNAFGAKYIIVNLKNDLNLVKKVVELAEFYLFDSKIAVIIDDEDSDLENAILNRVDCAIYKKAINCI